MLEQAFCTWTLYLEVFWARVFRSFCSLRVLCAYLNALSLIPPVSRMGIACYRNALHSRFRTLLWLKAQSARKRCESAFAVLVSCCTCFCFVFRTFVIYLLKVVSFSGTPRTHRNLQVWSAGRPRRVGNHPTKKHHILSGCPMDSLPHTTFWEAHSFHCGVTCLMINNDSYSADLFQWLHFWKRFN